MIFKAYLKRIAIYSVLFTSTNVVAREGPWRLADHLQLAEQFSITGQHRTRFETLDEQYRGSLNGGDQAMMLRTLVKAGLKYDNVSFTAEFQDSRVEFADSGSALSTSSVNPLELLQANVGVYMENLFVSGSRSSIKGGRLTMDVGSRRLVARNRFRNTINAFTGVDWQWTGPQNNRFRAFYVLPVQRLVEGSVLDNDPKFDKEHGEISFWGVYYQPDKLPWGDSGEVYLFGLNEDDIPGRATRDRDLYTLGFRVFRQPEKQQFDYQIESVYQFGESRSSTSSTVDLDHFAHFQHLEIGYTFDASMSPQLLFQYDYASGDDDPADNDNNRFDTLFGARRFDFGPTSIYGPFARSNLSSPGLRLRLKPDAGITSFISLRGFWLASSDDPWTTAGIGGSGAISGSYIGTQIEARLRWEAVPDNVRFEAGTAHLFAGEIMDNANRDSATYLYSQLVFWF